MAIRSNNTIQAKRAIAPLLAVLLAFVAIWGLANFNRNNHYVIEHPNAGASSEGRAQMVLSFSNNTTLRTAFIEFRNGYQKLASSKQYDAAGYTGLLPDRASALYNSGPAIPYIQAKAKYHPFFKAYITNQGFGYIYLIDSSRKTILYSSEPGFQLPIPLQSAETAHLLEQAGSMKPDQQFVSIQRKKTGNVLYCAPLTNNNEVIGYLVLMKPNGL
jgi:hypothetical protein